jgi:hypothetical protein
MANSGDSESYANRVRKKRMKSFAAYFPEIVNSHIRILDLGGTINYWKQIGYENNEKIEITLLNLQEQPSYSSNISSVSGDACDLSRFKDKSYDIVFSNSVIEHVGGFKRQKEMASELIRVGKGYFVQTPNYWFPLEPHFLIIGFQYMPGWLRRLLIMHFNLGWYQKIKEKKTAKEVSDSIHLLSKKKLQILFPGAIIVREPFLLLTKSFIAIKPINKKNG